MLLPRTHAPGLLQSGVGAGDVDVFLRPRAQPGAFLGAESADDFPRRSHDHRAGGDFRSRGNDGSGGDQALVADHGPIENDGAHADKAFVAHRAGMDDRPVADRAIRTDDGREIIGKVDDRAVLDVRPLADDDRFDVATQDAPVENARVLGEPDVAHDPRVGGDEGGFGELGLAREEGAETVLDGHGI